MIQFYSPDIEESLTLPESDSGHCIRVLRMSEGDAVEVVDGRGHVYRCHISVAHPKRTRLSIDEVVERPKVWPGNITIAVAPTKNNDRMEWLVEKLVEIGVDRIVPVRCRHSERKEINTERLVKIAVSAMKQSLKAILPAIEPMTPLHAFLDSRAGGQNFVGYCDPAIPRVNLAKAYQPGLDTAILIGPEGDFDPAEISDCLDRGWQPVTMGDNRLRTETAALVACDTCHIINQVKL